MTAERKYKTFPKERRAPKPIRDGAFETVVVFVKSDLGFQLNETMGPGDSDFWIGIEAQAADVTPKQACHDFYRHNIGHRTLAAIVVDSFRPVRAALNMGDMEQEQRRLIISRIAHKLYPQYPPRYRQAIHE
jgi:hypothetical protein